MENKICVYAICKNELKHIDRWLNSMSEADYIVVLDTGSTDGTYEKLKEDSRITRVEQKIIKPWRFDVARNESMKLIPDDSTVLVCTDFDEFFEPGWGETLRNNWDSKFTKGHYLYAWSHNDAGEPGDVYVYDKIHNRDYHWVFPVHEVLLPINKDLNEHFLDFGDMIYLHHLPDKTKSRSNYLDLLKLSVKENPDDAHVRNLYAREFLIQNNHEQALKEYLKVISMPNIKNSPLILIECYGRLADLYDELDQPENVLKYCYKFIELDNTYREPYFILGNMFLRKGQVNLAKSFLELGFNMSTQKFIWIERAPCWQDAGYKLLGECNLRLGLLDDAFDNYIKAYNINPTNQDTVKNIINITLKLKEKYDGKSD